jgi:hypothetical protein
MANLLISMTPPGAVVPEWADYAMAVIDQMPGDDVDVLVLIDPTRLTRQ